jgi:hypothetical protein
MNNITHISTKKILIIAGLAIVLGVVGYFGVGIYKDVAQDITEKKIREAGLNPDDYELSGVAPWNVRSFVTDQEIKKAGLNPDDYDIKGTPTADEARREVIMQELTRQLAEYDMTIDDIDLTGVDLMALSPEEIQMLVYEQVRKKIGK